MPLPEELGPPRGLPDLIAVGFAILEDFYPSDRPVRVQGAPVDSAKGQHPKRSNGLIGRDPATPDIVVAANGGSDLVYLPQATARALAPRVVEALLAQDYVSGVFVDDALGAIPGTLPLSAINLKGSAVTPTPAIVVNFRTFDTGCGVPVRCSVEIADTGLQHGQGMHGSFGRSDTHIFMAAIGPSFRRRFVDPAPAGNADVGATIGRLLNLGDIPHRGRLVGRVLLEALNDGAEPPRVERRTLRSPTPSANGLVTILNYQTVGETRYFDTAGFPGRTVGLTP